MTLETQFDLAKYPNCEIRDKTKENVGNPHVTLFTLNHFYEISVPAPIETPVTHDYAEVNAKRRIEPRIERCRNEIHRLPNFLALDFANQGDGLRIVQELNQRPREDWQL